MKEIEMFGRIVGLCVVACCFAAGATPALAADVTLTDANSQVVGSMPQPMGMVEDPNTGDIYAVGRLNARIFKKAQNASSFVPAFDVEANSLPVDIDIDATGNLYVTLHNAQKVVKYSPQGTVLGTVVDFNGPHGVALDGAGNVHVGEWAGQRMWKVATSAWIPGTTTQARYYETAPRISTGHIGDLDFANGGVYAALPYRNLVARFTNGGDEYYRSFTSPLALAVDGDRLYVSEWGNGRVQVRDVASPDTPLDVIRWSGELYGVLAADGVLYVANATTAQIRSYVLPDGDGDGTPDSADNCPTVPNPDQSDIDGDGQGDACDTFDGRDGDGDGVSNGGDNCPAVANTDQLDADGDGSGDACDTEDNRDADGDGVQNHADNCVDTPNPDQDDTGGDALGDACDGDHDGVASARDNCPEHANADQADVDGDGAGDACDSFDDRDTDGDGVKNGADNCVSVANSDQADVDGDGAGDACDAVNDLDLDNDGANDDADNCVGLANGDQVDTDQDGEGDACDADNDGDGFADGDDACATDFGTAANGCPMPTRNAQCTSDGWRSYSTTFRNQGDCVSYIATRGKNKPAGSR